MNKKLKLKKARIIVLLCIIVAVAFIFLVLMPHHHCSEPDCQLCSLISSYKDLVAVLLVSAASISLLKETFAIIIRLCRGSTLYEYTPVYLKVKLSN